MAHEVDTLRPFRTLSDVSASFFLLISPTRDFMYNNTIGITIRFARIVLISFYCTCSPCCKMKANRAIDAINLPSF